MNPAVNTILVGQHLPGFDVLDDTWWKHESTRPLMEAYLKEYETLDNKYWALVRALPKEKLEEVAKLLQTNAEYTSFMSVLKYG